MRFVVPSLFTLLFAGPAFFDLRAEGRGPRAESSFSRSSYVVTRDQCEVQSREVSAVCGSSALEPRPSALLDGIVFAQQSAADVSLNAQLLTGARNGDEALVRRALDAGAAPNSRNRTGDTALMFFIRKGNAAMVDLLLGKGADVNLRNLDKVSPLMAAAYHGHSAIARALLDRDADVGAEDQLSKTAMVYAAAQGHSEIVSMLLGAGVDVNRQYKNDLTALMWAAGYGKADSVRLLLEKGADPNLKDNRGKTARQIALDAKHQSVAELLAAAEPK